jgi:chromosome segregation ATPase
MSIPSISSAVSTTIPQEWSLLSAFECSNPLKGRCDIHWQDALMLTGIFIAVAGAVGSFSLAAYATGAAFTAVGLTLLYSAYYVHYFNDGIALQDDIQILRRQNQELQAAERRAADSTAQLTTQYTQAQRVTQQLNQTISSLQSRTRDLETANTTLTRNNQALQSTAQQLQQNNQTLQQRVTALQQTIPQLRQQIASFTAENIQLGANAHGINVDLTALNQQNNALAQTIHGIDLSFDQNIVELNQEIQQAQAVARSLFGSLADQKRALEQQVQNLEASSVKLNMIEVTLRMRTEGLTKLEQDIETKQGDLGRLNQELQNTKTSLDQEKQAFELEVQKLTQARDALAAEESNLAQTKNDLAALPAKFAQEEQKLKEAIEQIEKEKNNQIVQLDTKIDGKIGEVKTAKQELQSLHQQIQQKRQELATLSAH